MSGLVILEFWEPDDWTMCETGSLNVGLGTFISRYSKGCCYQKGLGEMQVQICGSWLMRLVLGSFLGKILNWGLRMF